MTTKKSKLVGAIGVLVVLAFLGLFAQMYMRAKQSESQAQELCRSFHVGDDATTALSTMKKSGAHFFSNEKEGYARFQGLGTGYIVCHIDYLDGKITKIDVATRN
jgi:hypothetical protein